jgi:hypothetical protein
MEGLNSWLWQKPPPTPTDYLPAYQFVLRDQLAGTGLASPFEWKLVNTMGATTGPIFGLAL